MINIKVYKDIGSEGENLFMSMFGMENVVFSLESLQNALSVNPNDQNLTLELHCDGGSVSEGLAIYDYLRTSGKNIYCNIDGSCHSMAIILLLAAPLQNRTANKNSRALIHRVRCGLNGAFTSDEIDEISAEIQIEEQAILDIYEQRTGQNRDLLANLMLEEKTRTAQELLDYDFISKINSYNTNKNFNKNENKMSKPNLSDRISNLFNRGNKAVGKIVNYDYTDNTGNVVFTTDSLTDTLAEGDTVIPPKGMKSCDGTFTLADGRIVTIASSIVTSIIEPGNSAETMAQIEEMANVIKESQAIISELRNALTEANKKITNRYVPNARITDPKQKTNPASNFKDQRRARKEGGKQ